MACAYASWLGTRVEVTAGQPYKHSILLETRSNAASSRSAAAFTTGMTKQLNQRRVHMTLNALSADFIAMSVALQGERSYFEEIGKRAVWAVPRARASASHSTPHTLAVDMDMQAEPRWMLKILMCLRCRADTGAVSPLPLLTFDLTHAQGAFRLLQRGGNVGKVVICISQELAISANESAIVTGGTSGLGLMTARWQAQCGVGTLFLASRTGCLVSNLADSKLLLATGVNVRAVNCDIGAVPDSRRLVAAAQHGSVRIRSLWHAAGTLADSILLQQNAAGLHQVFASKVIGAWALQSNHAFTPLRTFALFSSVAALLGGAGQANYSAANSCVDSSAERLRLVGQTAVSVQWGPWADIGMAAGDVVSSRMRGAGFGLIGTATGLAVLRAVVQPHSPPVIALMPLSWSKLIGMSAVPSLLSALVMPVKTATDSSAPVTDVHASGDAVAHAVVPMESVLEMVKRTAGSAVDADAPLMDAGLDSLGAVELRNLLQQAAGDGMALPSTLVFDYPTGRQVAAFFLSTATTLSSESEADNAMLPGMDCSNSIEVMGSSIAVAMGVMELDALCAMSHSGHDLLCQIPFARWDLDLASAELRLSPSEVSCRVRHGAFLHNSELFVPGFFNISKAEAAAMDPQQRQLLERGYAALHDAGLSKSHLLGAVVAVNVGQWESEFASMLLRSPAGRSVYAATGFSCSVTCGRVSFALGLQGPCASFNTACSASLVANHSSTRALQRLECDWALSAGVNAILDPVAMRANAIAGFTSANGRSRTFDVRADGYARGEAIDAIACRRGGSDLALWMIGSAVRQDGRSASLTAPNGQAQQGLLKATLADAPVKPMDVAAIEAHGTGTALGDPIEAGALVGTMAARHDSPQARLVINSLKANAGHTEPGAGLAGALKLITQLLHRSSSPNAQLRELNRFVARALDSGTSFALPTQAGALGEEEPSTSSVTGGVSSFGYSGTIAHALLRQASPNGRLTHLASSALSFKRSAFVWYEAVHPFVQQRLPGSGRTAFRAPTAGALHALVAEHTVQGGVVFPGAGFLEMGRAMCSLAGDGSGVGAQLRDVLFLQPLLIEEPFSTVVECTVSLNGRFEVRSGTPSADALESQLIHCNSAELSVPIESWRRVELTVRRAARSPTALLPAQLYNDFHDVGLQYGPSFRPLQRIWAAINSSALAQLRHRVRTYDATLLHATDLDGSLQLCATVKATKGETRLPFAVLEAMLRHPPISGALWATAMQQSVDSATVTASVRSSTACAQLDGFKMRSLRAAMDTPRGERRWLYAIEWSRFSEGDQSTALAHAPRLSEALFIGPVHPGLAKALADSSCTMTNGHTASELERWQAVILAAWMTAPCRTNELQVVALALELLQAQAASRKAPPVWICTHGAQAVNAAAPSLSCTHGGLWGLTRACRQEVAMPTWCIDVHDGADRDEVHYAMRTLVAFMAAGQLQLQSGVVRGLNLSSSFEPEAACYGRAWHAPRLVAPYGTQLSCTLAATTFTSIRDGLDAHTARAMAELDMERLAVAYELLEGLCQQYVRDAATLLSAEATIPLWHHRLLHVWFAAQLAPARGDPLSPADVRAAHPDMWAEVQLAERCGPRLAEALTGAVAYQELLFPGGSMEAVLPVYESGATSAFYNRCVVAAVELLLALLPAEQRVVVLEIGAGTGGTASSVLPVLESRCMHYVFTDVSEVPKPRRQTRRSRSQHTRMHARAHTHIHTHAPDSACRPAHAGLFAASASALRRVHLHRVLAAQHRRGSEPSGLCLATV